MKISKATIVRTVMVVLVLVNMILKKAGLNILPVSESGVAKAVETGVEVLSVLAAWWYNNSFSENALKADKYLKELKEKDV